MLFCFKTTIPVANLWFKYIAFEKIREENVTRKESSEKCVVKLTYKSCSGTILGSNDFGWKSGALIE